MSRLFVTPAPHLIDANSGVGTQVMTGYPGNSNYPGIVVGNKQGVFVFTRDGDAGK